jgi:RimJ/RimL family protein N-acetyltransferase
MKGWRGACPLAAGGIANWLPRLVKGLTMTNLRFETDSLRLRPFEPDDVALLHQYLNHPELAGRRYIPWAFPELTPLSQQQVSAIVAKWSEAEDSLITAILHKDSGDLLGHAECDWGWDPHNPSLSVVIAPTRQRQGHASAAINLLLRYLFEQTPAYMVSCWVADWNEPGLRFAAQHGFQIAGRMRRAGIWHGQYFDVVVTYLPRSDWQQSGGGPRSSPRPRGRIPARGRVRGRAREPSHTRN